MVTRRYMPVQIPEPYMQQSRNFALKRCSRPITDQASTDSLLNVVSISTWHTLTAVVVSAARLLCFPYGVTGQWTIVLDSCRQCECRSVYTYTCLANGCTDEKRVQGIRTGEHTKPGMHNTHHNRVENFSSWSANHTILQHTLISLIHSEDSLRDELQLNCWMQVDVSGCDTLP